MLDPAITISEIHRNDAVFGRVLEAIKERPGSSSAALARHTGFTPKLTRRILYLLQHHDPRHLIVRATKRSAYWLRGTPRTRPAPPVDRRKQPIFRRGAAR